jgi:putative membrane protein insertion efficiency factor
VVGGKKRFSVSQFLSFLVSSPISFLVSFYQRYISPVLGQNCRHYPSCSQYTKLQFKKNNFFLASYHSTKRILSCNQLFDGGIDYPVIKRDFSDKISYTTRFKKNRLIKYWYINIDNNSFYLIEDLTNGAKPN